MALDFSVQQEVSFVMELYVLSMLAELEELEVLKTRQQDNFEESKGKSNREILLYCLCNKRYR